MKKLIIGRGNDCDIVIPDETDEVSRHHAELIFDFWGKMQIVDTSANGTFLNGVRLEKGRPMEVRRTDNVSLAKKWDFDWNTVTDPYAKQRPLTIAGISLGSLALLALIGWAVWFFAIREAPDDSGALKADSTEVVSDSTSLLPGVDASKTPVVKPSDEKKDKAKDSNTPKASTTPKQRKANRGGVADSTAVWEDIHDSPGKKKTRDNDLRDIKERDSKSKSSGNYNL